MRGNSKALLFSIPLTLLLTSCGTVPPVESQPGYSAQSSDANDARAEIGMFYDSLAPHGHWLWDVDYGWVWSPSHVSADWRPYTDGWWAYTDVGWCWQSDLAWGWAPFHYGRWAFRPARGWIWLPDTVWAPAWVAWRCDDQWVGWAPLPPQVGWRAGIGLRAGAFDLNVGIEPSWWSFCAPQQLVDHNLRRRIEPVKRNVTLVHRTRDVTHLVDMGRVVADRGLGVDRVEQTNRHPVKRYTVSDLSQQPVKALRPRGDQIQVYRPQSHALRRTGRTGGNRGRTAEATRTDPRQVFRGDRAPALPAPAAAPQPEEQNGRDRTQAQQAARETPRRDAHPSRHWSAQHRQSGGSGDGQSGSAPLLGAGSPRYGQRTPVVNHA